MKDVKGVLVSGQKLLNLCERILNLDLVKEIFIFIETLWLRCLRLFSYCYMHYYFLI